MVKCQFTTKYWNYEYKAEVDYNCPDEEETLGSGRCLFHDENYLKDEDNRKEHEQKARVKLMDKVRYTVDKKEALLCIGYHLPDVTIKQANFTKPVYFSNADLACVDFSETEFSRGASFGSAKFSGVANFNSAEFSGVAYFYSASFSQEANFSAAKFSQDAIFSRKFPEEANYSCKFFGAATTLASSMV